MKISSAYMFAKQIKAGEAPQGDVYFVNGNFNPQLVPAGFTNFDDMLVPLEQGNGDVTYMQYLIENSNLIQNLIGTPYIIMLKGDMADWWETDGTVLKRKQTTPVPQSDPYSVYGHYSAALMFPIVIPNTYKKVHIQYETKGNMIGIDMGEEMSLLWQTKNQQQVPSGSLSRTYENTIQGLTPGEYEFEMSIDDKSGQASFNGYKYVEFNPWIGLEEVIIKKIWFTL